VKIVLDTNVLISAVFFGGLPFQILQSWREGRIELVVSPEILEEYQRVAEILGKDHPTIDLSPILELVVQNCTLCDAPPLPSPVCEDPDDDKFIASALAGGCAVIVSGDNHLLKLSAYQKIEILKPREFIDKYLT
jgi:putative PIN family toxin of toxin-antitoxin system